MSNELVKYEEMSFAEIQHIGQHLAASQYFRDASKVEQAVTKILAGRELGIPPVASLTGIYLVEGKVTIGANVMAALVKKSDKYSYRVKRLDNEACILEFFEKGKSIGESSFTKKDIETAELQSKSNWKKYPRNMMFARAMSNGVKFYCPDLFMGPVYTTEEMEDAEGLIIEVEPVGEAYVEQSEVVSPKSEKSPVPTGPEELLDLVNRNKKVSGYYTSDTELLNALGGAWPDWADVSAVRAAYECAKEFVVSISSVPDETKPELDF